MGRKRSPLGIEPSAFEYDRCFWDGVTGRCRLPIEMIKGLGGLQSPSNTTGGPGFCGWHYDALENPRWVDDYDEFLRWWEPWYGPNASPPYCNLWSHYPPSFLWAKIRGESPSFRLPDPCHCRGCRFRPRPSELYTLTVGEHIAKIKTLVTSSTMARPVPPTKRMAEEVPF